MTGSYLDEAADRAWAILQEIEAATTAFAAASGIRCRAGCGECCLKPGVETEVVEMLPLARALTERGEADLWHERASAAPDGVCVFYGASEGDRTLGRCGQYDLRPSICRLFGFAAVSGKNGTPQLASCKWHKQLTPEIVEAAQKSIEQGAPVPLFSEFSLKMRLIAPDSALAERLPINRALCRALEKISLSRP